MENLGEKKTRRKHFKMFPQKVLDAGEIKILGEINMTPKYMYEFEKLCWEARSARAEHDHLWSTKSEINSGGVRVLRFHGGKREYDNSRDKIIVDKWEKIREDDFLMEWYGWLDDHKYWNKVMKGNNAIAKYMGVKPFITSVMINISPNWKGQFGVDSLTDKLMIKKFKAVVETYLKASNRYGRYKYNLECGGDGNHLHAHIVAEFNPKIIKSVTTHINKGNHAVELRKIWDKIFPKGHVGYLRGKFAVQRIILRNENLLVDKLKYLIEEEKPEGHKNLKDLGILVNEGF